MTDMPTNTRIVSPTRPIIRNDGDRIPKSFRGGGESKLKFKVAFLKKVNHR